MHREYALSFWHLFFWRVHQELNYYRTKHRYPEYTGVTIQVKGSPLRHVCMTETLVSVILALWCTQKTPWEQPNAKVHVNPIWNTWPGPVRNEFKTGNSLQIRNIPGKIDIYRVSGIFILMTNFVLGICQCRFRVWYEYNVMLTCTGS